MLYQSESWLIIIVRYPLQEYRFDTSKRFLNVYKTIAGKNVVLSNLSDGLLSVEILSNQNQRAKFEFWNSNEQHLRYIFFLSIPRDLFHFTLKQTFNRDVYGKSRRHLEKNTDFNYFTCPPMLALISTRGLLLCRCMQQHSETTAVSLDGRQTFSALEVRLFDISLIILVYLRLVTFSTIQS